MSNLRPDVQQDRFDLLKSGLVAAYHQGKVPLFEGDNTARDRRIQHMRALGGHLLSEMARGGRADGTHINIDLARAQSRQYAIGSREDCMERGSIGHHAKGHIGSLDNGSRRLAPMHSSLQQPVCLRFCTIIAGHTMPGSKQSLCYPTTHCSQANKTQLYHNASQNRVTLRLRSDRIIAYLLR